MILIGVADRKASVSTWRKQQFVGHNISGCAFLWNFCVWAKCVCRVADSCVLHTGESQFSTHAARYNHHLCGNVFVSKRAVAKENVAHCWLILTIGSVLIYVSCVEKTEWLLPPNTRVILIKISDYVIRMVTEHVSPPAEKQSCVLSASHCRSQWPRGLRA